MVSSEYCNQIAYDAIQVHGGTGYMKDFPVERLYRDARITSIYEGTSQIQKVIITTSTFEHRTNTQDNQSSGDRKLCIENLAS